MVNDRTRGSAPDPGDSLEDDALLDGSVPKEPLPFEKVVGDDSEPPQRTGFEDVDPAAGGPQPDDVSKDYASRNSAHERAANDAGDNRSHPDGEPADPDPFDV